MPVADAECSQRTQKIWVISEVYYPDDNPTGYFLTGIAEGLAKEFDVRVLCTQPSYTVRGKEAPRNENHRGVSIDRVWSTTFDKNILPLRLVNSLTVSLSIFLKMLWGLRRKDRVLVVNVPPISPLAVGLACRLRGVEYTLLIHDVYPDAVAAAGMLRTTSVLYRMLNRVFGVLLNSARHVVVLGRDMFQRISDKRRDKTVCVTMIPNWADLELVPRTQHVGEENAIRQQFKLDGKFVVQYSGNMGLTHNLDVIVAAARDMQNDVDLHFLLVGSGARKTWVTETVANENLHNVTVADRRPREELNDLLLAADVSVISFLPAMAGVSVPSRLYNVMAVGCPVIAVADPESELARTVAEERIGWVVPPNDVVAFRAAVDEAKSNPAELAAMRVRARRAAEVRFSYSQVVQAYRELLKTNSSTPKSIWDQSEMKPETDISVRRAA
ncbi:glycosyltransferase family 4 protein [Thalassoroseus pseudoceratinae]|uniref:glycosyltransferase family 4 protein n=1 Tax=Thalassoroseus pseudoceratinae TaxID=2713176 RepID=UPI00141DCFDC|nr:glycosyltransferase family 4 protein [Thalassoroseus pseudoceratinae]